MKKTIFSILALGLIASVSTVEAKSVTTVKADIVTLKSIPSDVNVDRVKKKKSFTSESQGEVSTLNRKPRK